VTRRSARSLVGMHANRTTRGIRGVSFEFRASIVRSIEGPTLPVCEPFEIAFYERCELSFAHDLSAFIDVGGLAS